MDWACWDAFACALVFVCSGGVFEVRGWSLLECRRSLRLSIGGISPRATARIGLYILYSVLYPIQHRSAMILTKINLSS